MSYKTKIIIFVVAIVLLTPLAATVFLNQSDVKGWVESYIEAKTGKAFTIEGKLAAEWSLMPVVYAEKIRLANNSWARTPFAFTADKLTISLSFAELIRGQLKVAAVELDKPQLWIEWNPATKKFNLDPRTSRKTANNAAKRNRLLPSWVAIEEFTIRDGEIFYFRKHRDWEFSIEQATIESMGVNRPTRIDALGEIEQTAVSMSGELGALESLLRFQESPVTLNGYVAQPANQVSISGVIENLFLWRGLNLGVKANVTNLTELSDLFGFWLPPYRNIAAQGQLIQPKTPGTMRLESLNLESSAHGLHAYAEGKIGQVTGFNGVDIRFTGKGNLAREIVSPHIIEEAQLATTIVGSVFGERRNLTLDIEHAEMRVEGISVHAAGSVSNALNDWFEPLPVTMKIERLDSLARLFGLPDGLPTGLKWADTRKINIAANLNRHVNRQANNQASSFDLNDIEITSDKISGSRKNFNLSATGKINGLGRTQKGEIEFVATTNRALLNEIYHSRLLALFNQLSLVGTVEIEGALTRLISARLLGEGDGIQLNGIGSAGNFLKFQDFQMDMQLDVNNLSKLESLANQPLPKNGSLHIIGVLQQDAERELNLDKIAGTLVDDDLTVNVDGHILALGDALNTNLNIDLRLHSLTPIKDMYPEIPFSGLLSQLLPLSGNAQLSGHSVDGEAGGYALKNITLTTLADKFNGQISGRIDNLFVGQDVPDQSLSQSLPQSLSGKLALELSGSMEHEFVAEVAIPVLNRTALSGDLLGAMDIVFSQGRVGFENIDFAIRSEQATLNASGAFSQISPLQADSFELKFAAESLASLVGNSDLPLLWDNPAKGVIGFTNDHNSQDISLDIEIAGNDLSGKMGFIDTKADGDSQVGRNYWAELISKNFDLTMLLVKEDDSNKLFSQTPLKLDWLMDTQTEINFSAEHFKDPTFMLDNFQSTISVDRGQLVAELSGKSGHGSMTANLAMTAKNQSGQNRTFDTHLDVNGKNVDFSALTKLGKSAADNAGIFSVAITLDGAGGSISEIAGNANGSLLLEFSGAKIKNDGLQIIGGDLFLGLLSAINPLSQQDEYLDIECGVVQFNVNNGVAQTKAGLALKTNVVTVLGGGKVTLSDEKLKLAIRPKARKGFGINTNSIAKMIRVGGTIKNPQIETDPKGLVISGLALGAALASGGASLLVQGLYDRTRANADVCRVAVGGGLTSAEKDNADNDRQN